MISNAEWRREESQGLVFLLFFNAQRESQVSQGKERNYSMKTETREQIQELKEILESYLSDSEQVNHWLRRFFRCYIDGSYTGEGKYRETLEIIRIYRELEKKKSKRTKAFLRSWTIAQFVNFLAIEFSDISRTTIIKYIKNTFGNMLEHFNKQLMDDVLDMEDRQ